MNRILLMFLSLILMYSSVAQELSKDSTAVKKDTTYWRKTLKAGINTSGSAFSDNWKGGGVNNFNYLVFLNYAANYKRDRESWDNLLDLQFGQIITKNAPELRKIQDRIFFDSKYGRALNKKWNLYGAFNTQTYFANGYLYKDRTGPAATGKIKDTAVHVASFINPAYFMQSIGFEYRPTNWYFVRLGVFAAKQTLVPKSFAVNEVEKNYGVDRGKSWRNEFGLFNLFAGVNKNVRKNVNIKATYQMFFSNIDYFFKRDQIMAKYEDNPEVKKAYDKVNAYMDHRVDFILTAKLTKFITTSFTYIGMYDFDQDKFAQHSHNLSVGIQYSFQNYVDPPKKE